MKDERSSVANVSWGRNTCQLSRIMRESHACEFKTSISRIEDNFSRLTHKSGRVVVKRTSFHFRFVMYYFLALYNNRNPVRIVSVQKSSEIFGSGSGVFVNTGHRDKNLTRLTPKKLAGIGVIMTGFLFAIRLILGRKGDL